MSARHIKLGNHLISYELTPLRGPRSKDYAIKAKTRELAKTWADTHIIEAERFNAEHFNTLLRMRRKEIEALEQRVWADYIRNYLRELGCMVLRTPTTADQLERDIRESYVTTAWYLLKEEDEVQ